MVTRAGEPRSPPPAGATRRTESPFGADGRLPYGLCFSFEDLVLAGSWTSERGLSLKVVLDQVVEGFVFEEVLVIARLGQRPAAAARVATLWITSASVFAQRPNGRPVAHDSVADALRAIKIVTSPRRWWPF